MFRIATWNVNSLRVRLPHVLEWLAVNSPDVLALQETKLTDDVFPIDQFSQRGYQAIFSGQKTYNGVAILSRVPMQQLASAFPGYEDPQKRVLCATAGQICVLNLYVPNGSEVGSDKYQYKLQWLEQLQIYARSLIAQHQHCVLLGDFNIAPADQDVYDPQVWQGQVLCSEAERSHFFTLLDAGLTDCYRLFPQEERSYSWWDYRAAAFRRNRGLRIDHILADKGLAASCRSCVIDKTPRKLEQPSDHAPVWADFDI
jgi:exodeoxyribonuclease-3